MRTARIWVFSFSLLSVQGWSFIPWYTPWFIVSALGHLCIAEETTLPRERIPSWFLCVEKKKTNTFKRHSFWGAKMRVKEVWTGDLKLNVEVFSGPWTEKLETQICMYTESTSCITFNKELVHPVSPPYWQDPLPPQCWNGLKSIPSLGAYLTHPHSKTCKQRLSSEALEYGWSHSWMFHLQVYINMHILICSTWVIPCRSFWLIMNC